MQLKFASYNIHKALGLDGRRDPERIVAVLREVRADVIALQEVDRRYGERASAIPRALLDDTPWRAVPVARRARSLGWHGNALLVRRDIEWTEAHALDLPMIEPRGAVLAELALDGKTIRVLGTHLDLSGLRRSDQVKALMAHCAERPRMPTVIMGDFNQWGRHTGAMRVLGVKWQVVTPGASYPAARPVARFDRIVTTPDWDLLEGGVHHSATAARASDHLPIWAELKLHKKRAIA